MNTLEDKKIIISTHVYTTGPAQDLRDFLIEKKVNKVIFIGHPLFYNINLKGSGYEIYEKGKKIIEKYFKIKKIPSIISYIKDLFLTVYWIFNREEKWDIYIGSDNLNAFSGLILKYLGKVKKVIYYVIDYNPRRFNNKILNKAYHKIDQICVKYCDETWNISPRMEEARKQYFSFVGGNQKVVPIGVWLNRIKSYEFEDIDKYSLIFMGHVIEKQGIQYVLDAIPLVIEEIPEFKLKIIGAGDFLKNLKDKVRELNLETNVIFTGYIEKHEEIEKLLCKSGLAVALYEKFDRKGNLSFTYFADPAKIKSYLACGLPVLLTDVSYNALEIEKNNCGIIIDYDKNKIAKTIIELIKNEAKIKEYRNNAKNYIKQFDWNNIFINNLERIL